MRCAALLLLVLACGSPEATTPVEASEPGRLLVYSVNAPLALYAERIGGDAVQVVMPVPADVDPADWSPDAETVAAFQSADLVLDQGAGYAAWLGHATLRRDRIVDTSVALHERMLPVEQAFTHQHGPGGAHDHAGFATETWLDPTLAGLQAEAVARALGRARPDQAEAFARRLDALESDLRELDERLAAAAVHLGGRPVLFSHPVYTYLTARYRLNARSLHWEPEEAPAPKQWRELSAILAEHPARLLVWEAEPLPETAAKLEKLGVQSVVFDPAGRAPASSVLERLRAGAAALGSQPAG